MCPRIGGSGKDRRARSEPKVSGAAEDFGAQGASPSFLILLIDFPSLALHFLTYFVKLCDRGYLDGK